MSDAEQQINLSETSDRELLRRFTASRDEAAFGELVRRYGPMVMAVCRRAVRDPRDAEDAFQLTFLTLAQNVARIRNLDAVGSWLHGVACRKALKVSTAQRRELSGQETGDVSVDQDPFESLAQRSEQRLVDEELNRLPDKYRRPLILHYLLGRSCLEVARRLGLSVAAVEGRLKRGRHSLRTRLARRGVSIAVLTAVSETTVQASSISPELLGRTTTMCVESAQVKPVEPVQAAGGSAKGGMMGIQAATVSMAVLASMAGLITMPGHGRGTDMHLPAGLMAGADRTLAMAQVATGGGGEVSAAAQITAEGSAGEIGAGEIGGFGFGGSGASGGGELGVDGGTFGGAVESDQGTRGTIQATGGQGDGSTLRQFSPAEQKVWKALETPVVADFIDMPLGEVMQFLSQQHGITIHLSKIDLEDIGLSADEPVRFEGNLSLKNTLDLILEPLDLDYVVRNDVLNVTSRHEADQFRDVRVYDVSGLVSATGDDQKLTQVITNSIDPESWGQMGGNGNAELLGNALVVTASQRVHAKVADLLKQLVQLRSRTTSGMYGEGGYGGSGMLIPGGAAGAEYGGGALLQTEPASTGSEGASGVGPSRP